MGGMGQHGAGAVAWEEEPNEIDSTEIDDFLFKAVATEAEIEPILKHEKETEIFGDSSGSDSFDEEAALRERERREARKKRKTGKKRSRSSRGGGRGLHHDFSSSESSDGDDDDEDWEVEKKPKKEAEKERERPKGRTQQKKASAVAKPPKKAKRVGGDPWAAAIHSSRAREDPYYVERPTYGQLGQQQPQQSLWRRQGAEHALSLQGPPPHVQQQRQRMPPQSGPPPFGHAANQYGPPGVPADARPEWQGRPPFDDGRGPRGPPYGRPGPPQQPLPRTQQPPSRAQQPPPTAVPPPVQQQQPPPIRTPSNPALAATLKELTESKSSSSSLAPPTTLHPDLEEARKSFKKYSSKIIVANVTKYNKEEALAKDAFKNMCRKLTHIVMEKEKKNNFLITHKTETMLVKLVDSHMKAKFPKHKRVLRRAMR